MPGRATVQAISPPVGDRDASTVPHVQAIEPRAPAPARILELDGLRGIAILLVVAWHYLPGIVADAPPRILWLTNSAIRFFWSGVDLFFVLSGFLIGGILLDQRSSKKYFKTFYARRAYRILPVYAATLSIYVVLSHVARPRAIDWLFEQPLSLWPYLTFTQNYAMAHAGSFGALWLGMTWSLAIEEQFYALLPLAIWILPERALWLALTAAAAAAPITRTLLFAADPHWSSACYMWMPARADGLMFGVLVALALRRGHLEPFAGHRRSRLYAVLAALALMIVGMGLMRETVFSPHMALYGYTILAAFYAVLLALAVTAPEGDLTRRVLRLRPLRAAGLLAYGAYLIHFPLIGVTGLVVKSRALGGMLGIVLTFALAALSWSYFEKPLVARGRRHQY